MDQKSFIFFPPTYTRIVSIVTLVVIALAIPLTVYMAQQRQSTQQRAFVSAPFRSCGDCLREGKAYSCFDSLSRASYCSASVSDLPNTRCMVCRSSPFITQVPSVLTPRPPTAAVFTSCGEALCPTGFACYYNKPLEEVGSYGTCYPFIGPTPTQGLLTFRTVYRRKTPAHDRRRFSPFSPLANVTITVTDPSGKQISLTTNLNGIATWQRMFDATLLGKKFVTYATHPEYSARTTNPQAFTLVSARPVIMQTQRRTSSVYDMKTDVPLVFIFE